MKNKIILLMLLALNIIFIGCSSENSESETNQDNYIGTIDNSFGSNGLLITYFVTDELTVTDALLQPDGKILIVGDAENTFTNHKNIALARYNLNGGLDNSFSYDGRQTTQVVPNPLYPFSQAFTQGAALFSNGKILVCGNQLMPKAGFLYSRYNNDGSPDFSFGNNGIVTEFIGSGSYNICTAKCIYPLDNGKFYAAGISSKTDARLNLELIKYNEDGSRDVTFGDNGIVTTLINNTASFSANEVYFGTVLKMVVNNNKIIIAALGLLSDPDGISNIFRFDMNGNLDSSFGNGGKLVLENNSFCGQFCSVPFAIQSNGNYLIGMQKVTQVIGNNIHSDFITGSFNNNGQPDTEFGNNGFFSTEFEPTNEDVIWDIVVQNNGKMIIAGSTYNATYNRNDITLCRINTDGTLDNTFGTNGKVVTPALGYIGSMGGKLLLHNNKINLVFTIGGDPLNKRFAILRFK